MEVRLTGTSSTPPATCRGIAGRGRVARLPGEAGEIRPGDEGVGVRG